MVYHSFLRHLDTGSLINRLHPVLAILFFHFIDNLDLFLYDHFVCRTLLLLPKGQCSFSFPPTYRITDSDFHGLFKQTAVTDGFILIGFSYKKLLGRGQCFIIGFRVAKIDYKKSKVNRIKIVLCFFFINRIAFPPAKIFKPG